MLNGDVLGEEILNAIDGVSPFNPNVESFTDYRKRLWKAIANAIVNHITSNAEVVTKVKDHTHAGVTVGNQISGGVAGLASGSVVIETVRGSIL